MNFDLKQKVNSQHLEPVELTVWALTAWKRETFMTLEKQDICPVFAPGYTLGTFPIPKDESCDLDTEEDWRIAEGAIYARLQRTKADSRYVELSDES